jgi:hypothetical protein
VELVVEVETVVLADVVVVVVAVAAAAAAVAPFSPGVSPLAPGASPGVYLLVVDAFPGVPSASACAYPP